MISRLHGVLIEKRPPTLVVDVNGLGYEVEAPLSTIEALPGTGQEVILHTHASVRDDGQALYGFRSRDDRDLFRRLIRVPGVGPKLGLALLSGISGEELVRCVRDDAPDHLTAVPGVGRKTAQKLIVELRGRLDGAGLAMGSATATSAPQGDAAPLASDPVQEAAEGLMALGYKREEASRMAQGAGADGMSCEAIIRQALQQAAP